MGEREKTETVGRASIIGHGAYSWPTYTGPETFGGLTPDSGDFLPAKAESQVVVTRDA